MTVCYVRCSSAGFSTDLGFAETDFVRGAFIWTRSLETFVFRIPYFLGCFLYELSLSFTLRANLEVGRFEKLDSILGKLVTGLDVLVRESLLSF